MTLEITTFADVDPTTYATALALVKGWVQAYRQDLDFQRGAFSDLVLYLSGALAAANQANVDRVRRSNSLQSVAADPALADADVLARLASNFGLVPLAGSPAAGSVAVLVTALAPLSLPAGAVFTSADGQAYKVTTTTNARTTSVLVQSAGDVLLTPAGGGLYAFTAPAVAAANAAAGNVPRLTSLTPAVRPVNFSAAYAAVDFAGGADPETNAQLLARMQTSLGCKSPSNRPGLEGLFRAVPGYADLVAASSVGYGDAEQVRYHSILPVAFGGRVDSYVKTQANYQALVVTKTATYQGPSGPSGLWRAQLTRDDAPGLYEFGRIVQAANANNAAANTYAVTADARNFDLSAGVTPATTFLPDVAAAAEAAYSRYATATVTFLDTDTPLAGLVAGVTTRPYALTCKVMPGVVDLQDAVSDRAARSPGGDVLVRAPVPVFTAPTVNVSAPSSGAVVDVAAVRAAVANAVNATGFAAPLPASVVVGAAQGALPARAVVTSATLAGRLRRVDGTSLNLTGTASLDPGTDAPNLVSARTVAYFCQPADVVVNVVLVALPQI